MALSYEQSLEFIHSIERFGSKPGLRRVRMLLERMGNPQKQLKFIHVAGSDGKGSTCAMISRILAGAGYRTGLYISPFVIDFRERIQLNNKMIPQEELAVSTSIVKAHWDALNAMGETPTEFEVVVAIAFDYFVRCGCEIVVLEVGLGGLFDATNVIDRPLVSVITHISMDHMQYLGDTIEKITLQKCGIIKSGGVTVSYPQQVPEALAVIMEQCAEKENTLYAGMNCEILQSDISGSDIRYCDLALHIPFAGAHQIQNAVTAVETIKCIASQGFPVQEASIQAGLAATQFPSRVEVLCKEPLVILDGAHNPAEMTALVQTLSILGKRKIHAVMGMVGDKDVHACLAILLPKLTSLIAVTPGIMRGMQASEFARIASGYCRQVTVAQNAQTAVEELFDKARGNDVLLCCGSLYLASELRPILLNTVDNRIINIK